MTDRNEMSGSAHVVVQAGAIHGDVHFHRPEARVPRQLPNRIERLLNQVRVLAELEAGVADRPPLDDPVVKVVLGPRGSGKSTVATSWLHECEDRYPDGQLYANLGAWTDHQAAPGEVLGEFLAALGVQRSELPADLATRSAAFRSLTHGRSLQVFLDDVVSPAQVRPLLPGRGGSVVVVTGHGAFGALRQQNATLIDVDPLERDMAVELLRQFAGDRVRESAALDAVLALCAGLPVALSLIGGLLAQEPDLSLAGLLEELTDPDGGITRLAVGDEPTLSSLFDVTYARLSADAQAVYRALGVHPTGELSMDALAAALDTTPARLRGPVRELVTQRVVEKPGRVVVHALVREHAATVAGAPEPVLDRLIAWYLRRAVAADARLMPQRVWRGRLFPELVVDDFDGDARAWMDAERGALRAVVGAAFRRGAFEAVVQLCVVLWSSYEPGKYYDDLLATHRDGVRAAERLGWDAARSVLLTQLGFAYLHRDEPAEAARVCAEAIEVGRRIGDVEAEATAVECAGLAALAAGSAEARELLRHNEGLALSTGDPRRIALARFHLAKAVDGADALALLDQALDGFRGLPEPEPRNLAKIMLWQGRKGGDAAVLERALAIVEDHDWPFDRAQTLEALGEVTGEKDYYTRALEIYRRHGFVRAAARVGQLLASRA
ncbi:NB-ARC domain-containing protein [Actinosynnema sp. CS-041913]|uniref:NB-ARC domain-containing protein n=1 Tax=Actinosynnema sp. CS-041913 TaxID=3239917 RepID=UPI003D9196C6